MRLKVMVDVEGVLADIHAPFIEYVNKKYRSELEELGLYPFVFDDITRWDWGDKMRTLNLSAKDCLAIADEIWKNSALSIPATESNLHQKITNLLEKYDVDIVTARKQETEVKGWLSYHQIPYDSYVNESRKETLGYHVIIEDDPTLCDIVPDSTILFLYDRPYNRNVKEKHNIIRVYSFDDIVQIL